jgi:hypothetical protein
MPRVLKSFVPIPKIEAEAEVPSSTSHMEKMRWLNTTARCELPLLMNDLV